MSRERQASGYTVRNTGVERTGFDMQSRRACEKGRPVPDTSHKLPVCITHTGSCGGSLVLARGSPWVDHEGGMTLTQMYTAEISVFGLQHIEAMPVA